MAKPKDKESSICELIECPVCTETDGIPKALPCGHTVCQICLQKIVDGQQVCEALIMLMLK